MDLNAVLMLIKVAESRSFTQAAMQLGTSQPRISRAVAQLEKDLGTQLLHRNTRSVSLTPDGCALVDRCAPLMAGLEEARKLVSDRRCTPSGTLRLTAPSMLGRIMLVPLLEQLLREHPQLQIDASFTDRLVDMVEEGFDAAVRIGPLADSRMIARALPPLRWVTVASPSYLAQQGMPHNLQELAGHRCLAVYNHFLGRRVPWQFLADSGDLLDWQPAQTVTFDSGDPLVEASLSGMGIAQVMEFAVREHLERGRLVRLLPRHEGRSRELSLVYPRTRQASPKIKALAQVLLAQTRW